METYMVGIVDGQAQTIGVEKPQWIVEIRV